MRVLPVMRRLGRLLEARVTDFFPGAAHVTARITQLRKQILEVGVLLIGKQQRQGGDNTILELPEGLDRAIRELRDRLRVDVASHFVNGDLDLTPILLEPVAYGSLKDAVEAPFTAEEDPGGWPFQAPEVDVGLVAQVGARPGTTHCICCVLQTRQVGVERA